MGERELSRTRREERNGSPYGNRAITGCAMQWTVLLSTEMGSLHALQQASDVIKMAGEAVSYETASLLSVRCASRGKGESNPLTLSFQELASSSVRRYGIAPLCCRPVIFSSERQGEMRHFSYNAWSTRWRKRANPALPNIIRADRA
jgi:hypothetical protein